MPYNVWIVDDEPIIRFGLASCVDWASEGLALAGEAANGQAALALLEERGFDADILITDIKMPLMDGIELIRRVKARRPNVKAVLVSSYSDFEYAREAVKLGVVVDYLLKPTMEPADLVRMLRACKERLEEDRLRHAKEAWIATEERHRRMLGFEAKLKAYLDGAAEPSFDWKPEWAQADLTIAVWKQDRTALREGALHRIVALETARDKLNAWCEGRGAALLAGEDELATLLADRGGGAWDDLRAFRQRLEDEEGLRFTVGVSPPFRRFPASLREAYGLASAALEQAFFRGRGACYLGGIPAAATGVDAASAERAERLREQFSKAFASADRDRCEAIFETHAALWTEPRRFARADIVQQARGLLIMMWSHHFRNNTEETMRAMIAKLEAVERAPTLTELTAFVRRELTRLWEPDSLRIVADDAGGAHVIQLALSYIQENYRRDISLQEVADTVHMSKNYFSEQFKRRTGLGFVDFVIRLRIHYAKHLLEHTGMRVHDVGLESGFNSPKHFLKLFKRMAGCTPAEYREKRAKPKEGDD